MGFFEMGMVFNYRSNKMSEEHRINVLITYHGFQIDSFVHKENFLVLNINDYKRLRKYRINQFVSGTWSLIDKQFKIFIEALFCFKKAEQKYFIDNTGKIERFSFWRFLFIDIPLFVIELLFGLVIIIVTWLTLFIFNLCLKKKWVNHNNDSKKIIYLRTDNFRGLQQGGSFTHFRGVVKGFSGLGYKIHYIGSGDIQVPGLNFPKTIIPHPLKFNLSEIPDIYYNWRFISKAYRVIKKNNPLFIYQRHSIFNVCGVALSQLTGVPLVLEYNGSESWVRQKWGGLLIFKRLCYFMENFSLKRAKIIVVVSKPIKEELIKRNIPESKILVNHNGVDIDEFNPNIEGSKIRKKLNLEGKIIIGAVSTFDVWHGMPTLAKAIEPVIETFHISHSKFQIHFLFIGDGVQRSECERIIKETGMENYVTFIGIIPYQDIPQYLAACDILVSPHIPNPDGTPFFGSPTKLFEYMAMGKGIVASDLDQIGEVLEHQKTAWLVKPGDTKNLVSGIIKLVQDKKLREELGKNTSQEIVKNYTWDENIKKIIDLYIKF